MDGERRLSHLERKGAGSNLIFQLERLASLLSDDAAEHNDSKLDMEIEKTQQELTIMRSSLRKSSTPEQHNERVLKSPHVSTRRIKGVSSMPDLIGDRPQTTLRKSSLNRKRGQRRRSSFLKNIMKDDFDDITAIVDAEASEKKRSNRVVVQDDQLPPNLRHVYDLGWSVSSFDVTGGELMYETYNEAIRCSPDPINASYMWLHAWRIDESNGPLRSFAVALGPHFEHLVKYARIGLFARVALGTTISIFDLVSDVLLGARYYSMGDYKYAFLTLLFPALLLIINFLFSIAASEHWSAQLACLIGMKPLYDLVKLTGGQNDDNVRGFTPLFILSVGRSLELSFESIPQTMVQMSISVAKYNSDASMVPDTLQSLSVISSLLAIGFIAANCEMDLDVDHRKRRNQPTLYGWYPNGAKRRIMMVFAQTWAIACTTTARIVSIIIIADKSSALLVAWICADVAFYILLKVRMGVLLSHRRKHRKVLSSINNFVSFVALNIGIFYTYAGPQYCSSGRVFLVSYAYMLLSQVLMVMVASTSKSMDEGTLRILIGIFVFFFLAGHTINALIFKFIIQREFKSRYYKHRTMKHVFRDSVWGRVCFTDFVSSFHSKR